MMKSNREETRKRRAAERILEDERLTSGLDDEAADLLLAWGVQMAEQIAASTLDLNDADAENASYQSMRALRRSMRYINKWLTPWPDLEEERTAAFLDKFLAQTAVVNPHANLTAIEKRRQAFARKAQTAVSAAQLVTYLRQWIEESEPEEADRAPTKTAVVRKTAVAPEKTAKATQPPITPTAAGVDPLESQTTIEQEDQEPTNEQEKSIWNFWG